MQKYSALFLVILAATALLAGFQALSGLPASTAIIRFLALEGFMLLSTSLLIGPVVTFFPSWGPILEPRRTVGISSCIFILTHVLLVLYTYFSFNISFVLSQPPLIVGAVAALLTVIVTLTSNDYSMRLLKGNWKTIQRLTYAIFVLVLVHFTLKSTGLIGAKAVSNPAEIAMALLAAVTVVMQFAAFFKKRKQSKERAAAAAQQPPAQQPPAQKHPLQQNPPQ